MARSEGSIPHIEIQQVVVARFLRGLGIEGDVIREVTAYYGMDGVLLCENDPAPGMVDVDYKDLLSKYEKSESIIKYLLCEKTGLAT